MEHRIQTPENWSFSLSFLFIFIQLCVGAIANRGQWEQGCSLFMATDLGPVRAARKKKKKKKNYFNSFKIYFLVFSFVGIHYLILHALIQDIRKTFSGVQFVWEIFYS